MKRLVIGILAHVDSGKTTLSEALLYKTGRLKKAGRVDHGNSFLDTDELEKERGITIFSNQAVLEMENMEITIIDTPGHVDFSGEMMRSLKIMDYAILVVSGSEPVQSHSKTLWNLLKEYGIPTFVFVNKMDIAIKKKDIILNEITKELGDGFVDFGDCDMEGIAVYDEKALDEFLKHGNIEDNTIKDMIFKRKIFPCFFGSALKEDGVEEFVRGVARYTQEIHYSHEFGARVYKIGRDYQGQRLSYMKVTGGNMLLKQKIGDEKVNQIRIYSGEKFKSVAGAFAGQICAVTGLAETYAGKGLGFEDDFAQENLNSVVSYDLVLPKDGDTFTAFKALKELGEEEPALDVVWNKEADTINIKVIGTVQMEVLEKIMKNRYGLKISFGKRNIVYKETIKGKVYGVGHFEPLKHYAEVHLLVEEGAAGSGVVFKSDCSEDLLDRNWQRLILHHLEEKPHLGVLTGSEITDVKITLVSGKAHKKHTEGGDFRQATRRAVRQALMQAESVLLEPWYSFEIKLPTENLGRAMSDIQKMGGTIEPPNNEGNASILTGQVAVESLGDYSLDLSSYTKALGSISCKFCGYRPCTNSNEVINKIGYNPERDIDNSPDSVFCEKGTGINLKWDKVIDFASMPILFSDNKKEKGETYNTRAENFVARMESDKELMAIFERTYGPVKRKVKNEPRTINSVSAAKPEKLYIGAKPLIAASKTEDEYLLIDGYNVIHDWTHLKELLDVDYGAARDKLVDILCNYQGFMKCKLIVVFDAYKVKGGKGSYEKIGGVNVVYTKEAETADMYIEKVTHDIGQKYRVRVVTSDRLEQLIITGHGALKVSSSAFLEEVNLVEDSIRKLL